MQSFCTLGGTENSTEIKQIRGSSEIKHRPSTQSSNATSGNTPQRTGKRRTHTAVCSTTFTEVLFTITKRWKQPKHPLTDEWTNQMWFVHTMGCYFTLKTKEIHTWYMMDKLEKILNKLKTKVQTLYDSIYVKYQRYQVNKNRKYNSGYQTRGRRK